MQGLTKEWGSGLGRGGQRWENWDNYNCINYKKLKNKIIKIF